MVRRVVALAVAVVFASGCTATVAGTGSLAPTAPATPVPCPGVAATVDDDVDLGTALPVGTPRLPSPSSDVAGLDLDGLLAGYTEPNKSALRTELTAAGFRDALQRTWVSGTGPDDRRFEILLVFRFADPAGACRFLSAQAARRYLDPIPVVTVPGAIGHADEAAQTKTKIGIAMATKGPYVVEADALASTGPVGAWTEDLLRLAYAGL